MCFSDVYLCMDDSCFMGHFLHGPPPHHNKLKIFIFIAIFGITNVVFFHKSIFCYCLTVKVVANNNLVYSYISKI